MTQRRTFWCVQRPAGLVPVADAQGTIVPGERLCRVTEAKDGDTWRVESVDRGPFGSGNPSGADQRDERRPWRSSTEPGGGRRKQPRLPERRPS